MTIDDMGSRGLITTGQISVKELEPNMLTRITLRTWMPKALADGLKPPLDIVVQSRQKL